MADPTRPEDQAQDSLTCSPSKATKNKIIEAVIAQRATSLSWGRVLIPARTANFFISCKAVIGAVLKPNLQYSKCGGETYSCAVGVVRCNRNFPPGFKFGAATAAYQVEGAWNTSDKSESIWDVFTHNHPDAIIDGSNGDLACDSYHHWKWDVEIASELGLHFYRFSISWTRLLPNGFSNNISEDGKKYYSDLIDALLAKGIEPVVTLYHWDLPQSLQKLGGWANPLIVDWFARYARVAYHLYADRVKTWITLNEPVIYCEVNYAAGMHAPGILSPGIGGYLCGRHSVLAHAKAWRIYDEEFKPKYQGKVSLTNQLMWFEPENEDEKESADLTQQFWAGIYTHPIFSEEGGWPPALEKKIAEKSEQEGYAVSRLPPFTPEEKQFVRGLTLNNK
ncbi:jg15734 [Pararge aegeria aegeria]|uniref:Jg15734 protein n=1 Tax=Pararge aegeria aegeria TaxID=348720 RepID=A0A8S4SID2_9NEOP|nr:jg15734 [Pararge aegeria aegeria]